MKFSPLLQYKLVETEHSLMLIAPGDSLSTLKATELCIGPAGAVLTFMDRYIYEREKGLDLPNAAAQACGTEGLTIIDPKH